MLAQHQTDMQKTGNGHDQSGAVFVGRILDASRDRYVNVMCLPRCQGTILFDLQKKDPAVIYLHGQEAPRVALPCSVLCCNSKRYNKG
jgi:hypothetical protein